MTTASDSLVEAYDHHAVLQQARAVGHRYAQAVDHVQSSVYASVHKGDSATAILENADVIVHDAESATYYTFAPDVPHQDVVQAAIVRVLDAGRRQATPAPAPPHTPVMSTVQRVEVVDQDEPQQADGSADALASNPFAIRYLREQATAAEPRRGSRPKSKPAGQRKAKPRTQKTLDEDALIARLHDEIMGERHLHEPPEDVFVLQQWSGLQDLPATTLHVLDRICFHCRTKQHWKMRIDDLAAECGIKNRRTIFKHLRRLKLAGLLAVVPCRKPPGRNGVQTNEQGWSDYYPAYWRGTPVPPGSPRS